MRRVEKLIFVVALLSAISCAAQSATINAGRSKVTVHVYKSGLFSALAHNHVIKAPIASGVIDKEHRVVSLSFNAGELNVADSEGSESDHKEIETTMKGPTVLDAAQFPTISFQSRRVDASKAGSYQAVGDLKLHGQTREVTVPVVLSGDVYKGSVRIKQTDFGITPVRVAGGTVRVKDEIDIEFEIVTQ